MLYNHLGVCLDAQKKHEGAAAAYRKALALRPDFALAHNNLGMALSQQQKPGAESAYRKALALRPDYTVAYNNLGVVLAEQRKYGEAAVAYRKAIHLQPDFALAYFNLADALVEQARFDEGLAFVIKGNRLLPALDPVREQTQLLLQRCQRYMVLEARLPAVLRGTDKPANAVEQLEFAQLCLRKKLYATAAHFYGGAFTADPKLTQIASADILYEAACAAALAGSAQGKDADKPDDKERAGFRRRALDWLREDLTWCGKKLESGTAQASFSPRQRLQHWQSDPDLAGVRAKDGLARLPEEEREQWERLWSDVDALLRRVSGPG
jgi:tetratricopeptide (TPR) repeat protein